MAEIYNFDPAKLQQLLYNLRQRQDISVAELAKRTGYSPEFIKEIERSNNIDLSVLLTILDALEYDWYITPRPKKIKEQLKESIAAERAYAKAIRQSKARKESK